MTCLKSSPCTAAGDPPSLLTRGRYGHQAEITALDCLAKERFVTAGRDATARIWKVVEETRLDFEVRSAAMCYASHRFDLTLCSIAAVHRLMLWRCLQRITLSLDPRMGAKICLCSA